MVQIISDKSSDWMKWLAEAVERLGDYPDISQMVLFANTKDDEPQSHTRVIEFMNCDYDDIYSIGGLLQKEAIKHEMAEEFGLDDEDYEFEIDEEDI